MLLIGAFLQNIGKKRPKITNFKYINLHYKKKKTPRTHDITRFLGVEILLNISTWLNESNIKNPDLIRVGQKLKVTGSGVKHHVVKKVIVFGHCLKNMVHQFLRLLTGITLKIQT